MSASDSTSVPAAKKTVMVLNLSMYLPKLSFGELANDNGFFGKCDLKENEKDLVPYGGTISQETVVSEANALAKTFREKLTVTNFSELCIGGKGPLNLLMKIGSIKAMPNPTHELMPINMFAFTNGVITLYPLRKATADVDQEDATPKVFKTSYFLGNDSNGNPEPNPKNIIINVTTRISMNEQAMNGARTAIGDQSASIYEIGPLASGTAINVTPATFPDLVNEIKSNIDTIFDKNQNTVNYFVSYAGPDFMAYNVGNNFQSDKWGPVKFLAFADGKYSL
jgi:hypothetical protein